MNHSEHEALLFFLQPGFVQKHISYFLKLLQFLFSWLSLEYSFVASLIDLELPHEFKVLQKTLARSPYVNHSIILLSLLLGSTLIH